MGRSVNDINTGPACGDPTDCEVSVLRTTSIKRPKCAAQKRSVPVGAGLFPVKAVATGKISQRRWKQ